MHGFAHEHKLDTNDLFSPTPLFPPHSQHPRIIQTSDPGSVGREDLSMFDAHVGSLAGMDGRQPLSLDGI